MPVIMGNTLYISATFIVNESPIYSVSSQYRLKDVVYLYFIEINNR